jgi:hypothetical protein
VPKEEEEAKEPVWGRYDIENTHEIPLVICKLRENRSGKGIISLHAGVQCILPLF